MEELKPCPFCGGEAVAFSEDAGWNSSGQNVYRAYCGCKNDDCAIGVELYCDGDELCDERDEGETTCSGLMDKAIKKWNRRAKEVDSDELLKVAEEIEESDIDGCVDWHDRIRKALEVE